MIKPDNKYSVMQKKQMNTETEKMSRFNHKQHNDNRDYWNILLGDIKNDPGRWKGKKSLDFGCGCGRNLENLLGLAEWETVDGVDISETNVEYCKKYLKDYNDRFRVFANNGTDLSSLQSGEYDFVMSTIVFQHICVHDVRFSLKSEIYRVLKKGGIFSFQMTYGSSSNPQRSCGYSENYYDAPGTNGYFDTRVDDPNEVIEDLKKIGFRNITHQIRPSFSNTSFKNWIYFRAEK